jgi:hypothetical protein
LVPSLIDPPADVGTFVILDVHLASNRVREFQASFAPLRVIPTWVRPVEQFTECPPPLQTIAVVNCPFAPPNADPARVPYPYAFPPPLPD